MKEAPVCESTSVIQCFELGVMKPESFKEALKLDALFHEAFERLTQHHSLTGLEENEIFESLPYEKQCCSDSLNCVKFLYECNLKNYNHFSSSRNVVSNSILQPLMKNLEIRST